MRIVDWGGDHDDWPHDLRPLEAVGWQVRIQASGPKGSAAHLRATLSDIVWSEEPEDAEDLAEREHSDGLDLLLNERVDSRALAYEQAERRFQSAWIPGHWYYGFGSAEPLFEPPATWSVAVLVAFGEEGFVFEDGAIGAGPERYEDVTVLAPTQTIARWRAIDLVAARLGDAAPARKDGGPFHARTRLLRTAGDPPAGRP